MRAARLLPRGSERDWQPAHEAKGVSATIRSSALAAVSAAVIAAITLTGAARGEAKDARKRPSAPAGLAVSNASETSITLTWIASIDNVGVTGYRVFVDGSQSGETSSTSYLVRGLTCATTVTLAVEAYDAAGNRSSRRSVSASTAACSTPAPQPPASATGTDTAASPTGAVIDSFDDTTTPWGKNLINRWQVPLGSDPWSAPGDTGTPWPSGGGIWQVTTPYGPGFRMVATDEMKVLSGGKKAQIADIGHLVGTEGATDDWSGKMMLPAAGNPNGFPRNYPDSGILVDFHDSSAGAGGGGIGIDTTDAPFRNNFYFDWNLRGVKRKAVSPNQLVYDRWYSWRIQIKFSSGSDGFIKWWLDGQLLADWPGATIAPGGRPYLQFGFYSDDQLRNEVFHAALRKN
jgi:Polysaccharide lyase/Fibronectin type III domain